jgi:hypothetical protein
VTQETDPLYNTQQFTYGVYDQVTHVTDKNGNGRTMTYYTTTNLWNWGRTKLSSCNYKDSYLLDISMENGRDRAVVITEKGLSNGSDAES